MMSLTHARTKPLLVLSFCSLLAHGCLQPGSGQSGSTSTSTNVSTTLPPATSLTANLMGINLGWVNDYSPEQYYADLVKTSRSPYDGGWNPVAVDANGWPAVTDFNLYLWSGAVSNIPPGNYALTFTGRAASVSNVSNLTYDARTNTSSGTLVPYTGASANNYWVSFSGSYRDGTTSSPGLTNIKIMRTDPSTGAPFPASTLFNPVLKNFTKKFSVARFMDFTNTNGNSQVSWSDRSQPNYRASGYNSQAVGVGASWEHVVLLANYLNINPWINVPAQANDDYVLKMAQLFAFGSDAGTGLPYTGPYRSAYNASSNPRPAQHDPATWVDGTTSWYPPLNPALMVYVEYTNEAWNYGGGFSQTNYIDTVSSALPLGSPAVYDNQTGSGYPHGRYYAMRSAQMSLLFRYVFGDSAMMTRVRPVLEAQSVWPGGPGGIALELTWAFNYLNNGDGNHVPNAAWVIPTTANQVGAHPPAYYWYGGGGAAYYGSDDYSSVTSTLTGASMNAASWIGSSEQDMQFPPVFGLKRIAYEGGASFDGQGSNAGVIQALMSFPSSGPTNMQQVMVDHQNTWTENGGDLLVYYRLGGDDQWGFLPIFAPSTQGTIFSTASPKLAAVDELNAQNKVAPSLLSMPFGSAQPGAAWVSNGNAGWGNSNLSGSGGVTLNSGGSQNWTGYTFRNSASGNPKVSITLSGVTTGTVQVYFDGAAIGSATAVNGTLTFSSSTVANPGVHGVIVRAMAGAFSLDSVKVN